MRYHEEVGPPPTVGLEIEVAKWKKTETYKTVAARLKREGYMLAYSDYDERKHDYHCRCAVCTELNTRINFPPLWKMQRDASLPTNGAEYISSPFPAAEFFIEQAWQAFRIISDRASYPNAETLDERGRAASVGMHIHTFVPGPELTGFNANTLQNVIAVMAEYIPEFFKLSQTGFNNPRGMTYRAISMADHPHHEWLALVQKQPLRIEWRFWECWYGNEEYFKGAILTSAALTQLMCKPYVMKRILGLGYLDDWREKTADSLWKLTAQNLAHLASEEKLNNLFEAIINDTAVSMDTWSIDAVDRFFRRAR